VGRIDGLRGEPRFVSNNAVQQRYYYDVEITGSNFHYKDSQGKSYTQAIMKKTFPTGNTLIRFITLPNIPAGSYTYKVWLVGQNVSTSGSFVLGSVPEITDISNSWQKTTLPLW